MIKESFIFKKKAAASAINYDRETCKPILKCSICNGEQVAGFKNLQTGKFEEVMLIRGPEDLFTFRKQYGIEEEIVKEY